jgi:formate dehydrogenase maturation protein FdhE
MSCNFHVRQALLKTAAKKRFEKILLMKEQFRLYLEPEVEYCWCGSEIDWCNCCGDCEHYSTYTGFAYCPVCGEEY